MRLSRMRPAMLLLAACCSAVPAAAQGQEQKCGLEKEGEFSDHAFVIIDADAEPFRVHKAEGVASITERAIAFCEAGGSTGEDGFPNHRQCGATLSMHAFECLHAGFPAEMAGRSTQDFLAFSQVAAENDEIFSTFRSHRAMSPLESFPTASSIDVGEQHLHLLRQHAPDLLGGKVLKKLHRQDRLGGGMPAVYSKTAGELGGPKIKLTPNTLTYAWVYAQLRQNFGGLGGAESSLRKGWAAGWKVCEVGGGYGGLASVLLALEPKIKEYVIYDQPQPAALQTAFLARHPALVDPRHKHDGRAAIGAPTSSPLFRTVPVQSAEALSALPTAAADGGRCDLVISHHALSLFPPTMQLDYTERLLADAQRAYFATEGEPPRTADINVKLRADGFKHVLTQLNREGYEVLQTPELPSTGESNAGFMRILAFHPAVIASMEQEAAQETEEAKTTTAPAQAAATAPSTQPPSLQNVIKPAAILGSGDDEIPMSEAEREARLIRDALRFQEEGGAAYDAAVEKLSAKMAASSAAQSAEDDGPVVTISGLSSSGGAGGSRTGSSPPPSPPPTSPKIRQLTPKGHREAQDYLPDHMRNYGERDDDPRNLPPEARQDNGGVCAKLNQCVHGICLGGRCCDPEQVQAAGPLCVRCGDDGGCAECDPRATRSSDGICLQPPPPPPPPPPKTETEVMEDALIQELLDADDAAATTAAAAAATTTVGEASQPPEPVPPPPTPAMEEAAGVQSQQQQGGVGAGGLPVVLPPRLKTAEEQQQEEAEEEERLARMVAAAEVMSQLQEEKEENRQRQRQRGRNRKQKKTQKEKSSKDDEDQGEDQGEGGLEGPSAGGGGGREARGFDTAPVEYAKTMAGGATAWAALDSEAQQKLVAEAVAALDEEAALNRAAEVDAEFRAQSLLHQEQTATKGSAEDLDPEQQADHEMVTMIVDAVATGLLDVEIAPLLRQQLLQTLGVDAAAGDGSSAGVDVGGGGGSAEEAKKKCSKQNQGQVQKAKAALNEAAAELFACRRSLTAHEWRTGQLAELLTAEESDLLQALDAEVADGEATAAASAAGGVGSDDDKPGEPGRAEGQADDTSKWWWDP